MKNFTNDFSYDSWKSDSFTHAKANGTVSVIGNGITTEQALAILKSKGLPSGWTVAQ
jgi:rRNA processing protein Krr1/Pno1